MALAALRCDVPARRAALAGVGGGDPLDPAGSLLLKPVDQEILRLTLWEGLPHVDVASVSAADLTLPPPAEGSAEVAIRVAQARALQTARFDGSGARTNAEADGKLLDSIATPDEPGKKLLADAAAAMRLSARGYHRVLRVARTIADLGWSEQVGRIHIAEALSYRRQAPRN